MHPDTRYAEIARAETQRGELVLRERRVPGDPPALELRAGGLFVMDTAEVGTERELAAIALDLADDPRHVLIGGLGLGLTLRRVLEDPRVETCTVVEVEAPLVAWMLDGTVPHGPALLDDPRVRTEVADVAYAVAAAPPGSCDLLLLDVDNGPGHLVHPDNAGLYAEPFLHDVRATLRPGGVVCVWSAAESAELEATMRRVFTAVEARSVPVDLQGRQEVYWLYLGRLST